MKKSTFDLIFFLIGLVGSLISLINRLNELDYFRHYSDPYDFTVYSKWDVLWPPFRFLCIMAIIGIIIELIFYKKK